MTFGFVVADPVALIGTDEGFVEPSTAGSSLSDSSLPRSGWQFGSDSQADFLSLVFFLTVLPPAFS
ncbi:MAG: hypothetical protein ACERKT_08915, partial [Acidobacteriota bacterium]